MRARAPLGAPTRPLAVLAAFASELPRGLPSRARVRAVVVRRSLTVSAVATILRESSAAVVTGSCGGLGDACPRGALVVPDEVVAPDGTLLLPDAALRSGLERALRGAGVRAESGRLVEVGDVVDGAIARADLGRRTGARFVDLESARLAAAAREAEIPWAVLRFVSDTPEAPLGWLKELLGAWPAEDPSAAEVLRALVRRPRHAPRLVALACATRRGARDVGRALTRLVEESPSPGGPAPWAII